MSCEAMQLDSIIDSIKLDAALAEAIENYRGVPIPLAAAIAIARIEVTIEEISGGAETERKRANLALLEVQAAYGLLARSVLTDLRDAL